MIPDGPFRFRLENPSRRFGGACATDSHHDVLAERRHWLDSDPERYAALLPDGVHGNVPGLNPAIGAAIETLLSRMIPRVRQGRGRGG